MKPIFCRKLVKAVSMKEIYEIQKFSINLNKKLKSLEMPAKKKMSKST